MENRFYLVHNSKDIVVLPDSCLVEIAAIGFHTVAFLVVALHSVQLIVVVAADICVAMEASDNFLEYF